MLICKSTVTISAYKNNNFHSVSLFISEMFLASKSLEVLDQTLLLVCIDAVSSMLVDLSSRLDRRQCW